MASGTPSTQPQFTLWHECFYACITERAPPGFELLAERIYSHHTVQTEAARQWLEAFILRKQSAMPNVNEREDYREMLGKLLASLPAEERLAGIPAEERLAGIPARERLAGIPVSDRIADLPAEEVLAFYKPEERIAGLEPEKVLGYYKLETMLPLLPIELLRLLPEDALRGLPEEVQQAIRRRLAGSK